MDAKLCATLEVAWEKIQSYCKKYAGCSVRDVQIRWKHDVYCWREFGVTPQGIAYINGGNHAQSPRGKDTSWIGHPEHKDAYDSIRYAFIELIVRDWPTIKEKLEKQFDEEKLIFAFEP